MRGWFGIGICAGKTVENEGGLFRSGHAFGASMLFTIAHRYPKQATDTTKAWRHIPAMHWPDIDTFLRARPVDAQLVVIECGPENTKDLPTFSHPERALYVLGAEDAGVNPALLAEADHVLEVPTLRCLNVATTGAVVMYDRIAKGAPFQTSGGAAS